MTLALPDKWIWDNWLFDDGENFHCFYLQAPKSLGDVTRRHLNASIGHSISQDLVTWKHLATAIEHGPDGAFDQTSTWTGSTVFNPAENLYYLFYTGLKVTPEGDIQSVGYATSVDLIHWKKNPNNPVIQNDPRFYKSIDDGVDSPDFRDPWVFYDGRDNLWHIIMTASLKSEKDPKKHGVIAHLTSPDLKEWKHQGPLSAASGFGQVEVLQVEKIDGKYVAIFCCGEFHIEGHPSSHVTGTYSVPCDSPTGPFHFERADIIDAPGIYAGRIVQDRLGRWNLFGFQGGDVDVDCEGFIPNPIPLTLTSSGTLKVLK